MLLSKFIEGLQILQPYYEADGYDLGAEHDQFYAYATDKPLPEAAVKRMVELGWFQPEADCEDDFTSANYNPEEGWSAYV